jgi:hypothetical protein
MGEAEYKEAKAKIIGYMKYFKANPGLCRDFENHNNPVKAIEERIKSGIYDVFDLLTEDEVREIMQEESFEGFLKKAQNLVAPRKLRRDIIKEFTSLGEEKERIGKKPQDAPKRE